MEVKGRDADALAEPDAMEDDEPDEGSAMADGRDDEAGQRWDGEDTEVGERRVAGDDGTDPEARAQVVSSSLLTVTVSLSSTLLVLSLCRSYPIPSVAIPSSVGRHTPSVTSVHTSNADLSTEPGGVIPNRLGTRISIRVTLHARTPPGLPARLVAHS